MTESTRPAPLYITMHEHDNVAIVANDGGLPAGTVFASGLKLIDKVPQGHKVALVDLAAGAPVLRYNVAIGRAVRAIPAGSWVHERLLDMPEARSLEGLPIATVKRAPLPPLEGYTFEGYRNADGSVGTRNILAITTTVQCVAGVLDFAVKRIKNELLPKYPNVDDVVGLEHTYGCGVAIEAPGAEIPIRTLRNISLNPNFGGEVMVVSLGCEKLQPERLLPPGSIAIVDERSVADVGASEGAGLDVVCLQDEAHVGFMSMIDAIMSTAQEHLERLNGRRRETVPASELVVGVQCGGSDAFSGVTANPAVGFCSDLLVRAGATVMFSEVTEVRDGIDQLTSRAANPEVAEAMIREMAWYDAYLQRGRVDRSANTTPGNKKGGLSNIVEKAMGSIVKSGSAPISGVLSPGQKLRDR
ncbi:MAG: galactarate dehydratase, partial [Burkholderiaceae bacterium]